MGKVKIRALVAEAGPHVSWKPGDILEVDEREAALRIADGRAEPIEPLTQRRTVQHGGQFSETAAVQPGEARSSSDQELEAVHGWLAAVDGLSEAQARALVAAGYMDLAAVAGVPDDTLDAVDGIGPAAIKKIRAAGAAVG